MHYIHPVQDGKTREISPICLSELISKPFSDLCFESGSHPHPRLLPLSVGEAIINHAHLSHRSNDGAATEYNTDQPAD